MKTKVILGLAVAALTPLLFSGCVIALGNKTPETKATLGKQLTDLKQARDANVINEEEYQAAKKRLIEGNAAK